MNILYVCNDLPYFCAHRLALARGMVKRGHRVTVAAGMVDEKSAARLPPSIRLERLDLVKHRMAPGSDMRLLLKVRALIRATDADIVHSITMKANLMTALALACSDRQTRARVALVMTFPGLGKVFEAQRGWLGNARRRVVAGLLRFAGRRTRPFATTENAADAEALVALSIAERPRTVTILGAGIPLDAFTPVARTGPPIVVFAGRLIRSKGVGIFLDAARTVGASHPQARFELAGALEADNPDRVPDGMLDEARREGTVRLLGAVEPSAMPGLLRRADIFCAPTLLREGLPRVVIEAMACGCAVIASDQPALRQIVSDGSTGWLLDPVDSASLAAVLGQALSDLPATRAMGRQASAAIRRLPVGEDEVVARFVSLYEEAVAGSSTAFRRAHAA